MDPATPENLAVARTYLDNAERLLNRLETSPVDRSSDWQAARDLTPASVKDAPTAAAAMRVLRSQTHRRIERAIARRNRSRRTRQITQAAAAILNALTTETLILGASQDRSVEALRRLLAVAPTTGTLVAAAATAEICSGPGFEDLAGRVVETSLQAYIANVAGKREAVAQADTTSRSLDLAVHTLLNPHGPRHDAHDDIAKRAAGIFEVTGQFDRAYDVYRQLGERTGMRRTADALAVHLLVTERLADEIRVRAGDTSRSGRIPAVALVAAARDQAESSADFALVIAAARHATREFQPALWQRYADACRREGREREALDTEAQLHQWALAAYEQQDYDVAAETLRAFATSNTASPERIAMASDLADRLARTEIDLTREQRVDSGPRFGR